MPINKTVDSILIANTHLPLYNGDLARFLRYKNIKQWCYVMLSRVSFDWFTSYLSRSRSREENELADELQTITLLTHCANVCLSVYATNLHLATSPPLDTVKAPINHANLTINTTTILIRFEIYHVLYSKQQTLVRLPDVRSKSKKKKQVESLESKKKSNAL